MNSYSAVLGSRWLATTGRLLAQLQLNRPIRVLVGMIVTGCSKVGRVRERIFGPGGPPPVTELGPDDLVLAAPAERVLAASVSAAQSKSRKRGGRRVARSRLTPRKALANARARSKQRRVREAGQPFGGIERTDAPRFQ